MPFLVKKQRNAVFEAIIEASLDPAECDLTVDDSLALVTHKPTKSFIEFSRSGPYYGAKQKVAYTARQQVGDEAKVIKNLSALTAIKPLVADWAKAVKEDANTPDLWSDFRRNRDFLSQAGYDRVSNALFGPDEQAQIVSQLRQIKDYIRTTYSLSTEQISLVEARLDEAATAANRIGRKDWLLLLLGVLLTLIVSGLVPPMAVEHIFGMTLHGLGHLFGGAGSSIVPSIS